MWRSTLSDLIDNPHGDSVDPTERAMRPGGTDGATQCYIDRVSVAKGLYKMYMESDSGLPNHPVLTAQRIKSSHSEYTIYTTTNGVHRDVGRLRSNVFGTAFTLYEPSIEADDDTGTGDSTPTTPTTPTGGFGSSFNVSFEDVTPPLSPATHRRNGRDTELVVPLSVNEVQRQMLFDLEEPHAQESERLRSRSSIRKRGKTELVGIRYEPNVFGLKGPRRMTIVLPGMKRDGNLMPWTIDEGRGHLVESFKDGDTDELRVLRNKPPQWNDTMMSYTLDFGGRVTVPSVKNFQLIHSMDANYIVMQMGKCRPRQQGLKPFFHRRLSIPHVRRPGIRGRPLELRFKIGM